MSDVVAFVSDLMDRSRIEAAVDEVEFITEASDADGATIVVVDLARFGDRIGPVRERNPSARIVAFGPHVDEAGAAAASAQGADEVLARSVFFRSIGDHLAR